MIAAPPWDGRGSPGWCPGHALDQNAALRLMGEAIGVEPLDERRYQVAIEVAMRHGRRDRAIRLLERARAMEAELADEPAPELASPAAETNPDPHLAS